MRQTLQQFKKTISKTSPAGCDFAVGDEVMFRNDQGVTFGPHRVIGFDDQPSYGRSTYIDCDCYWFPKKPGSLNHAGGAQ